MKLHTTQSPPVPSHLVPLRPKYLPQHTVVKVSQPMLFPQCERQILYSCKALKRQQAYKLKVLIYMVQ
jgi:hypothetical protein